MTGWDWQWKIGDKWVFGDGWSHNKGIRNWELRWVGRASYKGVYTPRTYTQKVKAWHTNNVNFGNLFEHLLQFWKQNKWQFIILQLAKKKKRPLWFSC